MNVNEMTLVDIDKRLAELDIEVREAQEIVDVEKATEEKRSLLERRKTLADLEERKATAEALNNGEIKPETIIEERKENKKMENLEIRNTLEYGKAFVKAIVSGDDTEARALLTSNASGTIPVPEMLENEIKNAWENAQVCSLAKHTNYKGNIKVGFEYSATGAVVHTEGTSAPDEETLVLGTVELKAESIKKWITISDEAIDGTTIDTLGYIYKELAQKIAEKADEILVGKITSAPATSSTTACAVPTMSGAIDVDTIVKAVAQLSGKARNLNILMNRQTYAEFISKALKANYGVDVFDGLKDKIVFTDKLPAYSSASASATYAIVGDFAYGAQVNLPAGTDLTIKVDELSLAEKDLVKIVGREYVAMAVVAPKAFVKVTKPAQG